MGAPLYAPSAVCDRSKRTGSAWSNDNGDENANPKNTTHTSSQLVWKTRPSSAQSRLMTTGQPWQHPRCVSAQPATSEHQRMVGRPASARPAVNRPPSARPASAKSSSARPESTRPESARSVSSTITAAQLSDQPNGAARQWRPTYRPMSASGCSVKESWATAIPARRVGSARSRSSRAATSRVDCGQKTGGNRIAREVAGELEHEAVALLRIVDLERERAAVCRPPSASPNITSLACYSKVLLRLIDRCVVLRPLLSRIKEAYDDTVNGLIRQLQVGSAKITRMQTGVDEVAGLDALALLATSDNPSDGRFAAEQAALQSAIDASLTRADEARQVAMEKRKDLDERKTKLRKLKTSCAALNETVEALRSTQNRIVAVLKTIQDRRMGDDLHKKSGYWLKRKIADTKIQTTEMRGQIGREKVEGLKAEAELKETIEMKRKAEEECVHVAETIEKWQLEIADIHKRTIKTEEAFKDYKRSVGPGTPRPDWEQVEKDLVHGSFADKMTVQGNDESALYRSTYATNPNLHIDVNQRSSTLAMQIANHVSELRANLVDTMRQLKDAETIDAKKKEDERQLKAVIEAEQAAVAESYQAKKFFILDGTGPNVPIYMRGTGKVRDVKMPKAEAEEIIKNVWDTKVRSDSRKGAKKLELGVFVAGWMKTTYGVRALEKTYNLVDALKRFEYDADCALFHLVLKGELCEDVYLEETRMLNGFMRACVAEDRKWSNAGKLNKQIRRPEFLKTLESHFGKKKPQDEIYALKRALAYDQPTAYIKYEELLKENERADQGHFAEELRDQFLLSVQRSYIEVEEAVREATIQRAVENGRVVQSEGPSRIKAHRVLFNDASCAQQCDTLMKESLLSECQLREYKRGDMVIVQGGKGTAMYLVIEGTAFSEKDGHEQLIEYGPGQLFGELSALSAQGKGKRVGDPLSRQATVTAHKDMLVMVLDAKELTLKRNEAIMAGDERRADCCTYALAAIGSIFDVLIANQTVTLESYRTSEKVAEVKRLAKQQSDGATHRLAEASSSLEHGIWTTVASCWKGCMDYVGSDDPDYNYEAAGRGQVQADTASVDPKKFTSADSADFGDPASAEKRARPLVAAGLGKDAMPGWEVAAGGLTCTQRVWLPGFIHKLRSVFIPLPRPDWMAAQAKKQGVEETSPGTRELSNLEKQAVSDVWVEMDKDGTGSLPSSKLTDVIELVYGYELTHKEQHALLLSTRYGGHVDASDISVTEDEFLRAMASVIELRQCEQLFEWRRVYKQLQPPSVQGEGRPRGVHVELEAIQPEAALAAMAKMRPDVPLGVLTRRLEDQLIRQLRQKQRGLSRTISRSFAKKNGDVDWDMFVRVLQCNGEITEGEAAEKLQCAWRVFASKKIVAALKRERDLALENKTSKKRGKTKRGQKGKPMS